MKLLDFLIKEPASATTQALEIQLEAAKTALAEAEETEGLAQEAFDADPSKEAQVLKAHEGVLRSKAHVDRAHRLLATRKREEEAQSRADIETQLQELDKQMQVARAVARELPDVTAHTLLKVVEAYSEQLATDKQLAALEHKYAQLAGRLGDRGKFEEIYAALSSARPRPYWHVVIQLFADEIRKLDANSHEGRAAEEIRRSISK